MKSRSVVGADARLLYPSLSISVSLSLSLHFLFTCTVFLLSLWKDRIGKKKERERGTDMDISAFVTSEEPQAVDATPEVLTAKHVARVEQLVRALDLLEKEVLWPYFEPVERVRVTNHRAVNTQDIVNLVWHEALAPPVASPPSQQRP